MGNSTSNPQTDFDDLAWRNLDEGPLETDPSIRWNDGSHFDPAVNSDCGWVLDWEEDEVQGIIGELWLFWWPRERTTSYLTSRYKRVQFTLPRPPQNEDDLILFHLRQRLLNEMESRFEDGGAPLVSV